jgi:uncharacterized protein (DUF849 family)
MHRTADRRFGDQYVWSALAAGRHQMPILSQVALLGGHVRVGLEDRLFIERGQLVSSNAEQVTKIRGILAWLGMQVATLDEARAILSLKGKDLVQL